RGLRTPPQSRRGHARPVPLGRRATPRDAAGRVPRAHVGPRRPRRRTGRCVMAGTGAHVPARVPRRQAMPEETRIRLPRATIPRPRWIRGAADRGTLALDPPEDQGGAASLPPRAVDDRRTPGMAEGRAGIPA